MNAQHSESLQPLALPIRDIVTLYGSKSLVQDCIHAGWLIPIVRRGRVSLFERQQVFQVWERITEGNLPPMRKCSNATDHGL